MRPTILKWKNLLEKVCRIHENDAQNFQCFLAQNSENHSFKCCQWSQNIADPGVHLLSKARAHHRNYLLFPQNHDCLFCSKMKKVHKHKKLRYFSDKMYLFARVAKNCRGCARMKHLTAFLQHRLVWNLNS